MRDQGTRDLIVQYLASPESEKPAIVNELIGSPDSAFDTILGFRGPYPESLDPRDAHDTHLVQLLAEILKNCPHLVTDRPTEAMDRYQRYPLLCAAICTGDPQFTDLILSGLKDRSIYIKLLVADAVRQNDFLRTVEAREGLERLLSLKSIAESDYDRQHIEDALAAFAA